MLDDPQKKAQAACALYQALTHAHTGQAENKPGWEISANLLKQALTNNPTSTEMKERSVAEARLVNAARKVIAISRQTENEE